MRLGLNSKDFIRKFEKYDVLGKLTLTGAKKTAYVAVLM
jgi:hypothetical protein